MKKLLKIIALHMFALCCISLCAATDTTSDMQVYYITPDAKVVEYRKAFAREYEDTETTYYGDKDSFVKFSKDKKVKKTRHYPAGFYYADSDVSYDMPVGRHIVYSVVNAGPNGEVKKVLVWGQRSKMTAERVARDAEWHCDQQLQSTVGFAVIGAAIVYFGGCIGEYCLDPRSIVPSVTAPTPIGLCLIAAGAALGGADGYYGYPGSAEPRLVDQQYMPEDSQKSLFAQMKQAGDNRVSANDERNLPCDHCTYVLEKELSVDELPGNGPHIDHLVIKLLAAGDVRGAAQIVAIGGHAASGSLGYTLPDKVITYSEDKKNVTFMASFQRMLGMKKSQTQQK